MSSQIIICQGYIDFHWSSDHLRASSARTPFYPRPHQAEAWARAGSTYARRSYQFNDCMS